MKNLIVLSVIILALAACDEPQIQDPLIGQWQLNTPSLHGKPAIHAEFNILPSDDAYRVELYALTINGIVSQNHTIVVTDPVKGDRIGKIKLTNGDTIIELTDLNHLGLTPSWYINGIQMEFNNQVYDYHGGSLTKN